MDPAVTILLETLDEEKSIFPASKKLSFVRDLMTNLRNDLSYLKDILEKLTENPIEDEEQKELAKRLIEAVYEAEDIWADFVAQETKYRSKSVFSKLAHSSDHAFISKLLPVVRNIGSMTKKVQEIQGRKTKQDGEGSVTAPTHPRPKLVLPTVEEDSVVGFDGEAEQVIRLLTQGSDDLQVISIIGMPGLGKSTLANMIFRKPEIEFEFYNRVWVNVSKDCNVREVFLQVLGSFTKVTNEMHEMSDQDLSNEIYRYLEREKYLIVLDDVWKLEDWDALKTAFPTNNKGSRILITTRHDNVASLGEPHRLKFLDLDESIKLLNIKALGLEECPPDLEGFARHIADECRGLPLSLVVIGGILREKGTELEQWRDVSKNVNAYITMDPENIMYKFIAQSFYQLPYSLKACFLYFGMFPEDCHISARKLIRMWIAEGFIQQIGDRSLEKIAEEYLEDLVNRNLVIVGQLRSNGKIKTCFVHDIIRSFCIKIAAEQNLYHEVKQFDPSTYTSSNPKYQKYSRICIHSQVLGFLTSEQFTFPRVRSFSCSSSEEINLPQRLSDVLKAFKLLRVLDGRPIIFSRFPRDLSQLVHLKYLVLSIKFEILPDTLSNLWNLQTLIIHTTSRTLEMSGYSLKLLRLRHLETNVSTSWPALAKGRDRKEQQLVNLTTLSTISPETCTKDAFDRVPNINKLGIRGELAKILNGEDESCSFDSLSKLQSLENLKLVNDVLDVSNVAGEIVHLPNGFPPNIKKLTLTNTQLDWSHMSTLGNLGNLEILKLNENAFKGKWWDSKPGEFCALKILHIERTDLVSWQASGDHFPSLRRLSLHYCTYLKDVPLGLADISSLEAVELFWTTTSAVASAMKIHERKNQCKGFKLLAYPPDHFL